MKTLKSENGVLMLEAAIYYPIVILIVVLILCIGMLKLQQTVLNFETDKVSSLMAKVAAYEGYDCFDYSGDTAVDLDNLPDKDKVTTYYSEGGEDLYRYSVDKSVETKFEGYLTNMITNYSFLNSALIDNQDIEVKGYGGLFPSAEVKVNYSIKFPHMFNYLTTDKYGNGSDVFDGVEIASYSKSVAINPAEYVRNVNLAYELTTTILKRFGFADSSVGKFMGKLKQLKDEFI